ncbi:MAG: HAD-IIIA family hydrolase [Actinomycetota bacterium]|nr:HAD-IIIA family hydrolase [Actinomycetota bacterium]
MAPSKANTDNWFIANPSWQSSQSRRGLLLDRDGVVNLDVHFAHRQEDFVFLPGIFELCLLAVSRGYLPILITNQSGIGRGMFSEDQFRTVTLWMFSVFSEQGIQLGGLYYCPTHPTEGLGAWRRDSPMRKPGSGMFDRALTDFNLKPELSIAIGDRPRDAIAAAGAGIGTNLMLSTIGLDGDLPNGAAVISELADAVPFLTLR